MVHPSKQTVRLAVAPLVCQIRRPRNRPKCGYSGRMPTTRTREHFNSFGRDYLPGALGVEILTVSAELVESRLMVAKRLLAPNGYLHAASVIALADTSCGYGCVAALPECASGFTTIELKSNFFGTARGGTIACRASPAY